MYAVSYENYKQFLMRSLSPMPSIPETVNLPEWEDTACSPLHDKGRIQDRVCCTDHRYFEWYLDREYFESPQHQDVTSPVFRVEEQLFYLEMSPKCRFTLRLYRKGPPVEDVIYKWRASVISYIGLDQAPIYDGRVDLSKEVTEWTYCQRLITLSSSYLQNSCLHPDGKVTFFLRIEITPMNFNKKVQLGRNPYYYGAPQTTPTRVGSIVEKEWKMYKKVQWDIPCKTIYQDISEDWMPSLNELLSPITVYKSPIFEISNQTFYISLEINRFSKPPPHYVRLYRKGPSVDLTVRWWVVVKNNGSNSSFASKNLDLTRPCLDWTNDDPLLSLETISSSAFSVEFLMSKVDATCGVIKSPPDGESPLELDPLRTEFLTFRARGHDFTVHRSLLVMRVPVFEAMLSHDTLESRTGILCLEDTCPVAVSMLLHYIDCGEGPLWGDKYQLLIIRITTELFILADKYLLSELRDMCLTFFEKILNNIEEVEYSMEVARKLKKELAGILSTIPTEELEKWPVVHNFHLNDPFAGLEEEEEEEEEEVS